MDGAPTYRWFQALASAAFLAVAIPVFASSSTPQLELVARAPEIVTPIGVVVDSAGRVLVLESHTHKPPPHYQGPKSDLVKAFLDADRDGRFEPPSVVAKQIEQGMTLALDAQGALLVCARTNLLRFSDEDADGVFERRVELLTLETPEVYPHNCLLSVTVSPDGWIYVGRGNVGGERWTLRAADGKTLSAVGDGGNVIRLRADGSELAAFATGFWNPFGLAFDAAGHLFCSDNDPDSRGPNRILHLVQGGDYGYRAQHGKTGLHPFHAWDGELPGTLPFVCGIGESPGTLINFPGEAPTLLVALWGEERIDQILLQPRGSSFGGTVRPWVRGDANFRPVALAHGPDGAVFVTDWASRDYANHGGGRLWRVKASSGTAQHPATGMRPHTSASTATSFEDLGSPDPFIRVRAVNAFAAALFRPVIRERFPGLSGAARAHAVVALRAASSQEPAASKTEDVRRLLNDHDEDTQFLALKWAGEEGLLALTNDVAGVATRSRRLRLFRAALEASWLLANADPAHPEHGKPGMRLQTSLPIPPLERTLLDERAPAALRAFSLALLPPSVARKHLSIVRDWVHGVDDTLQQAAVWALAVLDLPQASDILARIIRAEQFDAELRADALVAYAQSQPSDLAPARDCLGSPHTSIQRTARLLLGLAHRSSESPRPASLPAWELALASGGIPRQGRRVFLAPATGCVRCHAAEGRGAPLGPDLSLVGRSLPRSALITAILEPSRQVAMDFQGYEVRTVHGEIVTGLQAKPKADGEISMLGFDGEKITVAGKDVAAFRALDGSLMPDGLADAWSVEDFRDLLAYLESLK